ncbi:MAG: hypothetical protein ACO1PB_04810 [Ramlibacter sp.]
METPMPRSRPLDPAPLDLSKDEDQGKLYRALDLGDEEQLKAWLDAGLDPNWEADGQTLLMAATGDRRRLGCARLLLARGADATKGHPPPLQRYLSEDAILLLLEAGADPRAKWGPEGHAPRLMEDWWEREGKRDGDADSYRHRIKMLRFWRRKRLGMTRAPECTRELALSLPERARKILTPNLDGVKPVDAADASRSSFYAEASTVEAWIERHFDCVDFVESLHDRDGGWQWVIWTRRDGDDFLPEPSALIFHMGDEHPETTLRALATATDRRELQRTTPLSETEAPNMGREARWEKPGGPI